MALIFNGSNQYATINNAAMTLSNGAIGFWYTFESKGSEFHYILSTGALSVTNLNMFYTESGANAGTMSFNRNGTYPNRVAMPADFKDGSTKYLVLLEKYAANIYIWYCKAGGTAVRTYIGALVGGNADLGSGQTYYLMARGDLAADRNSKGRIDQFFKMGTDPIDGLTAAVVEDLANGVITPQTVVSPHVAFLLDEGAGSTATDEVVSATMNLVNSPTWDVGAPVVTPIAFSGTITNQTFNVGDAVSVDLATGRYSGTETPFTYANVGTALTGTGLSISSAGVLSGTATEATVTGAVMRGTDDAANTADSNAFNITVNAVALVPQGTVTIGTITTTDTTASVPFSYDDTDQTGFEFDFDGNGATTAPTNPLEFSSLTPLTTYTIRVRAINAAGSGAWSTLTDIVTEATPVVTATFTSEPLKDNTGTLLASEALDYVALYDNATGALVLRVTGLSTNASGIFSVTDEALTASTVYKVDWKITSQTMGRMPAKATV